MKKSLIWFRQDLRLNDNPALAEAIRDSDNILAVYILDEESKNIRLMGAASKWWLHHALQNLKECLKEVYNIDLLFFKGEPLKILQKIVKENEIESVYWSRLYEPYHVARDKMLEANLKVKVNSFNANLLSEPWEIQTGAGSFYKVYGAYKKAALAKTTPRQAKKKPNKISKYLKPNTIGLELGKLKLLPTKPDWSKKFEKYWEPTEKAGHDIIYDFLDEKLSKYKDVRDIPSIDGTSALSTYLHFGQISPHQIIAVCKLHEHHKSKIGVDKFLSQIYWREFSYHLIYHFPMHERNFDSRFNSFKWETDGKGFKQWKTGQTGYPIVDAGMRQLWETGIMHNRVRMIVASFLCKHLRINWKHGEKYFWDTLVDADLANNAMGWQWVAGSGVDAMPYYRIFNPILQGDRFDKQGAYVRKWCPELENLPDKYIHKPWEAPEEILKEAGIILGKTYPKPLVDHVVARQIALVAYRKTWRSY